MGKLSTNISRSGKYMPNTRQMRNEAQRQMVRSAVLKENYPTHILQEMTNIDNMVHNESQANPWNERILHDNWNKRRDTLEGVQKKRKIETGKMEAQINKLAVKIEHELRLSPGPPTDGLPSGLPAPNHKTSAPLLLIKIQGPASRITAINMSLTPGNVLLAAPQTQITNHNGGLTIFSVKSVLQLNREYDQRQRKIRKN